jgi:hypothetical protein
MLIARWVSWSRDLIYDTTVRLDRNLVSMMWRKSCRAAST